MIKLIRVYCEEETLSEGLQKGSEASRLQMDGEKRHRKRRQEKNRRHSRRASLIRINEWLNLEKGTSEMNHRICLSDLSIIPQEIDI